MSLKKPQIAKSSHRLPFSTIKAITHVKSIDQVRHQSHLHNANATQKNEQIIPGLAFSYMNPQHKNHQQNEPQSFLLSSNKSISSTIPKNQLKQTQIVQQSQKKLGGTFMAMQPATLPNTWQVMMLNQQPLYRQAPKNRASVLMGAAVMERRGIQVRKGGGGTGGIDDDDGNGNNGGRGRGGGDGRGDGRDDSPSGQNHKSFTSQEKYSMVNHLIYQSLLKVLDIGDINKMISAPLKELQYYQLIRSYILSEEFPYSLAWDLKTRKLHFYMTHKVAIMRYEPPSICLTNLTFSDQRQKDAGVKIDSNDIVRLNQDFEYVALHIIKDHEDIGYLDRKTMMLPGRYVFVPEKKVYELVGEKLLQVEKDQQYVEQIIKKSQSMDMGTAEMGNQDGTFDESNNDIPGFEK